VLRTDDEEQAMGKVAPSVIAREQLQQLLAGSIDRERNIVSALVEAVTRLVVQELVEGEQADWLGGRGRYERREEGQVGSRNGYEPGRIRTAEGLFDVAVPQVRGTVTPFRSSLMSFSMATATCWTDWLPRCTRVACPLVTSRTRSGTRPGSC
jgi:hypothetical protein